MNDLVAWLRARLDEDQRVSIRPQPVNFHQLDTGRGSGCGAGARSPSFWLHHAQDEVTLPGPAADLTLGATA